MSADMEVSITGCSVGKMHEVLWCHVKNLTEPVAMHVNFEVKVRNVKCTVHLSKAVICVARTVHIYIYEALI